jgi:bacterioferritin-associated ferredoxin
LGLVDQRLFSAAARPLRRRLARLRRFRAALDSIYRLRPGLCDLADDDTIVCRCEEIRRSEVDEAARFGAADFRALKVATRLGMGPCQGRFCWPAAARRLARSALRSVEDFGPLSVRPPAQPLCLGDLVAEPGPAAAPAASK